MDYIEEVEDRIETITGDTPILPGIRAIHTPVHTEGGLSLQVDTADGKAMITGFCVIMENFFPPKEIRAMEMEVIPPGTPVNVYDSYNIMLETKETADILIPLHEPGFASIETITGGNHMIPVHRPSIRQKDL